MVESRCFVSVSGIIIGPFVREDESMSTVATGAPVPAPIAVRRFLSPARVLVRSLRLSRDNWKGKYQKLQQKLKRYQVQAHDACNSRDGWRERAVAAEWELENHQSRAALQAAAEPAKKK